MKKSELIALLYLSHQNLDHLNGYAEYIEQFNITEEQIQAVLNVLEAKSSSDLQQ